MTKYVIQDLSSEKMKSFIDKQLAFLFGLDNQVDKEIMRYIYRLQTVSLAQLILYISHEKEYCSERRLMSRLKSLHEYGYINKFEAYNNVFYQVIIERLKKEEELDSLRKQAL